MKKYLISLLAAAAFCGFNTSAKAALITFDDHTVDTVDYALLDGYQGFNWNNFGIVNTTAANTPKINNGAFTIPNAGYNGYGRKADFSKATPFTLNSAYFSAWAPSNFTLRVVGYKKGIQVGSIDIPLLLNNAQKFTFNFPKVDKVEFIPFDGGSAPSTGEWFTVDNIDYYAPVPEPSTMILGFLGLGSLFGLRRKNK